MNKPLDHDMSQSILLDLVVQTRWHSDEPGAEAPAIDLDSRLDSDLGFDSLSRAELLVNVEQAFGVQLPESLLSEAETPRDLLKAVARARGDPQEVPGVATGAAGDVTAPAQEVDGERFTIPHFETFQEALQWHARTHPQRTYLQWVKSYDDVRPLTFGELHQGSLRVANGLFQHDLEPRDTVALMLPTGHDYFYGFFGALYANAIPVPLYPPMRTAQLEEHLRRQADVLNNAQARILVTVPEARRMAVVIKALVPSLEHVVTPDELWSHPLACPAARSQADDIAFLQYTSGSTGHPKGVQLSHANLFANIGAGAEVLKADQDDVFVSWLPLYHDMGLIGTCLSSLWLGMHLVIMSPLLFLTKPRYWLWAIHQYRGTLSPSPNFGYELCLQRLSDEDLQGLDLSSWRVALNGAEAVSPATVERFIERFGPWGFRPETMAPVYGLAENCVALTFPESPHAPLIDTIERDRFQEQGQAVPASPDDATALRFVACGKPIPHNAIRIVDDAGQALPERREGSLQFTGPSATRGYYRNPDQTAELFDGEWLNTGDRGYMADGELYLTGRNKDLIVRAGRNLYPAEIEEAVGELEHVRRGCVAAFASGIGEREGERLVVVAESRQRTPSVRRQLTAEITRIVRDNLGIDVDDVVIVKPHSIPKTSSGKLRRNECRLRYERGDLERKSLPLWHQLARLSATGWRRYGVFAGRYLSRRLYAGWCWCVMGGVGATVLILANLLPTQSARWQVVHQTGRALARLTGTPLVVEGAEKLRQLPEGCVIVANHASYVDAFVIAAVMPVPVSFVAKAELTRIRLLRRLFRRIDVEPVERASGEASVRASRRIAEHAEGRRLMYFAEGTFDAAPGLKMFHMGAFMTAAVAAQPVLPIGLTGTRQKLPADRWNPRPGPIGVRVGELIWPEGDDWAAATRLRNQTRQAILELSGEPDRMARPAGKRAG
ncbi:MAG: AMP-binding protein [Marinobacter sp.]|uniref:AMP-binding protein n=1 Tax=Marinobacter sp. TaxID=50741 RepID=UPI00299EE148|nr:AMP-binding protein [Marinobacter sp.]MDX1757047.1 AMP-binding protein [Marinobacter sp.]